MKKALSLSILASALCACQTMYVPQARDVKKKPNIGGVIGMPTNYRAEDRQKADTLMKQTCGENTVKITEEGEVVTGQSTRSNTNTTNRDDTRHNAGNLFGIPVIAGSASGQNSENTAVTTQLKEWQVAYDCDFNKANAKARK